MRKFILVAIIGFIMTVFLANSVAGEANQFVQIESKVLVKSAQRSYIFADDGTVLARLFLENREDIPVETVPDHVQKAFIAIEDTRFYKHHGVDYYAIGRALISNIKHKEIVEGGSTITQQYVKNSLGNKDKTITRKMREAVLASNLEQKYSKKQILEAYLNTIYFGQGAYGIEAASEVFLNKKAVRLTLAEGALLAGVTKSPSEYSPYKHPEAAFKRQSLVLTKMLQQNLITKKEYDQALKERPTVVTPKKEQVFAPYFVEYVKQQLIKQYGVERVFMGGLRIHTTLNLRAQKIAEKALASQLNRSKDPEGAIVSINPRNGHIVAMVGGRSFDKIKYNLATQGKRQPGSAFKPFVLVTALANGYGPNSIFDSSSPQTIKVSSSPYADPWTVHNCEGHGYGMMTLREATVNSVNCVYANLTMKLGAEKVAQTARAMGITTPIDPYPAIGIGGLTVGVTPLEMASAYGTLATGGIHYEPIAIKSISDYEGTLIIENNPNGKQVLKPNIAYEAVDIMKGVIRRGTATRANIGRPAAGKTGTNGQYRDAWFVGFTPQLVTSVWMGYPQAQISMYNVHGNRGFGGIIPATIWHKYTQKVLVYTPPQDFPEPVWPREEYSSQYGSSNRQGQIRSHGYQYNSKRYTRTKSRSNTNEKSIEKQKRKSE